MSVKRRQGSGDQKDLFDQALQASLRHGASFKCLSLWAVETVHSTATLSIQRVSAACMGSGSCTEVVLGSFVSASSSL